jgi:hypothetical protein
MYSLGVIPVILRYVLLKVRMLSKPLDMAASVTDDPAERSMFAFFILSAWMYSVIPVPEYFLKTADSFPREK